MEQKSSNLKSKPKSLFNKVSKYLDDKKRKFKPQTQTQEDDDNERGSKIRGQYIEISQPFPFPINLGEIEVFSSKGGPNIITPRTAVSSSSTLFNEDTYAPKNFVDGNKDTFVHTTNVSPSVLVDLGSTTPIYQINVYNRTQCCQLRINGAILTILDTNKNTIYTSNPFKDQSGSATPVDEDSKGLGYGVFSFYPPSKDQVGSSPY